VHDFLFLLKLGGGFQDVLFSPPKLGGFMIQFDEHFVQDGLVQPLTRNPANSPVEGGWSFIYHYLQGFYIRNPGVVEPRQILDVEPSRQRN